RSVLPVVRSPNRSMERTLGQVFLTFNEETKRSLLPNEVTSMDTVKALFVRSFPHSLTMRWFDDPMKKVYILDRSTNVFYELEDLR
ncbi:hypothetical protein HELRODRAFT_152130, partial [Helobdella robusta]|uniref:Actin interacting protein 3-like C-terminal domain-containing protein n=1 Tax=Helobdella robusta TaxID=6412 RepID=T1EKP3_HELRO